jgi:inosose dehydratase
MHSVEATEGAELDPEQWQNLVSGTNELARVIKQEYGVDLVFHPHVDTHVDTQERIERFLTDTDPQYVNLCLDTGHIAYCHGDNVQIVQRFPERITYVHLKQVDTEVRERVRRENLPLSEAVKLGAMVEPPYGEPDMPPLLKALAELDTDLFCVIEQDLYPVEPDVPLPIAARTAGYFVACGLGPVRRWPYNR